MARVPDGVARRLDELIGLGDAVGPSRTDANYVDAPAFYPWRAASIAFLERVLGATDAYTVQFKTLTDSEFVDATKYGTGILRHVQHDLNGGYLLRLADLIAADLIADVWDQADELLRNGYKDAAASLGGAALETGLRQIAQTRDVSTEGLRGIDRIAKALVDAGHMTAVRKRQIDAWREIRNSAAHGAYEDYGPDDVRRMLDGVRDVIADELH
jgi:hypothetical protein